jgi:hypothetical protein
MVVQTKQQQLRSKDRNKRYNRNIPVLNLMWLDFGTLNMIVKLAVGN